MIVLNLKLDRIYGFDDFEINFTYPKKVVNSIIDDEYLDEQQLIAYDFMDFYTKPNQMRGRQLSLDTEYIVRAGDSYWMIARQLGMELAELLLLNNATVSDRIVPGQRIKIA